MDDAELVVIDASWHSPRQFSATAAANPAPQLSSW
jgi:hypothetical protein